MWEPPWKRLVEDLEAEGFESPYLDRLRGRLHAYVGTPSLEQEILSEMAYALGRAEDKVNLALLELDVAAHAIETSADPDSRARRVEAYNALRDRAKSALRDLMIHREALGMRRHDLLARFYPIPPRR